jgi:signal transduction histidine kinase
MPLRALQRDRVGGRSARAFWRRGASPRSASVPATGETGRSDSLLRRNAYSIASVRLLLALGNGGVIWLDPSLPLNSHWPVLAAAYGAIALIMFYSFWVWRQERAGTAAPYLPRLATWLDVGFSAALIATTGADRSPFFMWLVFTIVSAALQYGWRTSLRVCVTQTVLYVAICLSHLGHDDFRLAAFLVRTTYLFAIALVLAYMAQRLLEQSRVLAGLQSASVQISAGRSTVDLLGRIADSLTELLQAEGAAVAVWEGAAEEIRFVLVNMYEEQGRDLLNRARESLACITGTRLPAALRLDSPHTDERFPAGREALAGVRNLLIARIPTRHIGPGVLVACNRQGRSGFTAADQELAELLAAQAGPLLETAHLQAQRRYQAGLEERHRIAAELHDGLVQTLASLDLRAVTCWDLCYRERLGDLRKELGMLKLGIEEAVEEARGAIHQLAPVRLQEEGLTAYLQEYLRKFHQRTAIPAAVSIDLEDRAVPEPTALLLIGLLREGLNNIRKHARATTVTLVVTPQGEQIAFRLADDGVGFAPEDSPLRHPPLRHYGLAYLRKRITTAGGELQVRSRPDEGTVLEARVPLLTEEFLISRLSQERA